MASSDVQPTGRANAHLGKTVRDMVLSMAVVLGVVGLLLLVTWRPQPDPVTVVDITPPVTVATMQAEFPVLVPQGLDVGWRPTSARWEPSDESRPDPVLHIGYVTPRDEYAQVSQSVNASAGYLAEQTFDAVATGAVEIGGQVWEQRMSSDRRALVLQLPEVTIAVAGTADWDELATLAASLSGQPSS